MTRRYITGIFATIHPIHPVSIQLFSVMTHWRGFQVRGPLGSRSRHLVGRAGGEGRVCTALTSLDLTSLTAVSGSGRYIRLGAVDAFELDKAYERHHARAVPTAQPAWHPRSVRSYATC